MRCWAYTIVLTALAASAAALALLPGAACATGIMECYRSALDSDPVYAQAQARFSAVKEEKPLAMADLMPNLAAGAKVAESNVYLKGLGPVVDDTYTVSSYSVTLSQAVIDLEAWAALAAADSEIKAAAAEVIAVRQDLIMRVVEKYINVLKARADLKVAESNVNMLEAACRQAEAFLRHGTGDIVAVQEARARLDSARSVIITAGNRVSVALMDLRTLTHADIDNICDFRPVKPQGPEPDDMEQWVRTALERQPLVEQAMQKLMASREQVRQARAAHLPKVRIVAENSYGMRVMRPEIRSRIWEAGLQVAFPLYLGGRLFAGKRQAVSAAEARRQFLRQMKDQARFATQAAFLELRDSVAAVDAADQAVKSAQVSLASTEKGFEVGTRTMVDVLDRIRDLQLARKRYNDAIYFHLLSRIRLKTASGTVSEKDLESLERLLATGK